MAIFGIVRESRIAISAKTEEEALEKANMADDNDWDWDEPKVDWQD